MHALMRAGTALVIAAALFTQLAPAMVVGAEPAVPQNTNRVETAFERQGPDGSVGFWVWDASGKLFGAEIGWRFAPVATWLKPADSANPPAWPEELTEVQAIAVPGEDGEPMAYWIWNPYRFVGGNGGPTFWTPTWEYHPATE